MKSKIAIVLACICTAPLASCNILGPALVLVEGPPTNPAQFRLPKDRSTVIFIDDRNGRMGAMTMRRFVAESAEKAILRESLLDDGMLIGSRASFAAAQGDTASAPLDLRTIGRNAQAQTLIYATVDSYVLSPDSQNWMPMAQFRVKVLDVTKDDSPRLWPEERDGFTLTVQYPQTVRGVPQSAGELQAAQQAFAQYCGESLAKLFYEHERNARPMDTRTVK